MVFLRDDTHITEILFSQVLGRSPSDLQKLSDAREFQENDVINAQKRLRSIRAKLAILEGKVALTLTSVSFLIPLLFILFYIPTNTESSHPILSVMQRSCWQGSRRRLTVLAKLYSFFVLLRLFGITLPQRFF